MSTFTAKSWDNTALHRGLKSSIWKGSFLFLLPFLWLSATLESPPDSDATTLEAATMAAFASCDGNILQNGSFETSLQGWATTSNTSSGRATTYASDGSYHSSVLPIYGTAETFQYLAVTEGDDLTLKFAAGVHDPTGTHKVGFQFLDISGAVLGTQEVDIENDLDITPTLQSYVLTGIAPAGTVELKVYGTSDKGYLRMDDFCLTPTPDPFASPPSCLLTNSSFENGITGWTKKSGTSANTGSSYSVDGSRYAYISSHFSSSAIYQDLAASEGQTYSMTAYAGAYNTSKDHYIGFEFLNSSGNVIVRHRDQVDRDPRNGAGLKLYSSTGTAPAGTAKVRVIGTSSSSYLKLDNICLSLDGGTGGSTCNVTFINNACSTLKLYWNNNGNYVYYADITKGGSYIQSTFEGHKWVLQYADGSQVGNYTSVCGGSTTITDTCTNTSTTSCNVAVTAAGSDNNTCVDNPVTITAQVSGNTNCGSTCNVQENVLVGWSLDACLSHGGYKGSNSSYTELTPNYADNSGCNVNASNVFRNEGTHSCTTDRNGTWGKAMCVGTRTACDFKDNDEFAVRFSVTVNPNQTGQLSRLDFYEKSPSTYEWTSIKDNQNKVTGSNDYPTKYGVRVTVNGQEVFKQVDFNTTQDWTLQTIDFSNDPDFQVTTTTTFDFELRGYCRVGNGGKEAVWDLDDIEVYGGCCAGVTDNSVSYNWSTGASSPTITTEQAGDYTVTITDCNGCTAVDVITLGNAGCTQDCELTVDAGIDQVSCDEVGTLTAVHTGESNCVTTQACDITATAQELVRWSMNDCYPYYIQGTNYDDCSTNDPVIISKGGCASISATPPCNNQQLDFSCNFGHEGGGGVCFPADNKDFYDKTDSDDRIISTVTITPDAGEKAALTGISFYHGTGIVTQAGTFYKEASKLGIRVIKNGQEIYFEDNIALSKSYKFKSISFTGPEFEVTSATTFEIEMMGYATNTTKNNGATWDLDEMKVYGGCCSSTTIASDETLYLWSTGATTPSIEVTESGTYSVSVADCNGCVATDEVVFTKSATPIATNDQVEVCCGVLFSGNAGLNDTGLNNPIYTIIQAPVEGTVTMNDDGSFSYEGSGDCLSDLFRYKVCNDNNTGADACCAEAAVILNILDGPEATISVDNPSVCTGEKATISVSATGGVPAYTYEWDNGLGAGTSFEVMPTTTTVYSVTVTDAKGCTDVEEVTITAESCEYDLALINTLANGQATTVNIGDQVTYNITIANQGDVPSLLYSVVDQIPAGMSFVSASDGGVETGGIVTWTDLANLDPTETKVLTLVLRVDDGTQSDYRNWAEISDDSADEYNTTDEDSTPDANVGNDNATGLDGIEPNDDFTNHNDITLDEPANDEDDNDYEDISLDANYDLSLVKTLPPNQASSINVGEQVLFNITITNQGNVPSNDYTVIDELPAGMSFVSASDGGTENAGVVTWANLPNLAPGGFKLLTITLRLEDPSLGTYRNWAEISDDSAEDYGAGVTDIDSTPDANINNDDVIDQKDSSTNNEVGDEDDNDFEEVTVDVIYDLALVKTLGTGQPTAITLGDNIVYNITIANQGNVPSNAYTVTDQIPAGMSFVSASDAGAATGGIVTWTNLPNINPGQTKVLALVLRADDATQSDFRNWAEISDDSADTYGTTDKDSTPDSNTGNDNGAGLGTDPNDAVTDNNDIMFENATEDEDDNDYEDVTLEVKYDLALINELGAGQATEVALGDLVTYKITVTNQGNVPSNDYTVTNQIPAGTSFVSASDGATESAGIVTWEDLANLTPGEMRMLSLILRVDDATQSDYRNWTEISEDSAADYGTTDEDSTPDANVGNDNAAGLAGIDPNDDFVNHNDISLDEPANDEDDNDYEDVTLSVIYDLALVKTLGAGQAAAISLGDNVSYEITVSNQGNVASNTYTVIDQIPAGMSFVSASDAGVESGGVVTWANLPNINAGQTKTLSIVLRVDDAAQSDFRNWAEISDDSSEAYGTTDEDSTPDSNTGNDNASGLGTDPNDDATNHNDITLDNPAGDEDDNDYEDVTLEVIYDLALINELGAGQATQVALGDLVTYTITVTNQGNVPSNDYTVTNQIPAGTSFVSASNGATENGGIVTWANLANLNPDDIKELSLILRVDDATQSDYRNWSEISEDSAVDYGTTDEDSTPDTNVGNDNAAGVAGIDPNDDFVNHNDISLDEPANDEDDNDYEDITLSVVYDLALVKTLAPGQAATIALGDNVSYEITVANQGNVPSAAYTVVDNIPAGMSFVSASDAGSESGGTVTWANLPNLTAGQTKTLSIVLRVDDATQSDYRNWAEITDDSSEDYGLTDEDSTPDSNTGDDNAPGVGIAPNDEVTNHNDITLDNPAGDEDDNDFEDVSLDVKYDLALINELAPGQVNSVGLGDNVTFKITTTNQGNVPSNDYTVITQLPAGTSFVSASDGGTESGGIVTWSNLANLDPAEMRMVNLVLRVDDATQSDYRIWSEISEDSATDYGTTDEDSTPDANVGNDNTAGVAGISPNDDFVNHNDISLDEPANDEDDNDYEDITLSVVYDLALVKTLGAGQAAAIALGDNVIYEITVANQGNVPSNAYTVIDNIPAGMSFVSASDAGSESAGVVTWANLPNLNAGQTKTLSIVLRVEDATQSDYRNWAEISDDSSETYGVTDEDSTPDSNTGTDNGAGLGTDPNDEVTDHNDITLDNPAGDEDDNDFEDVTLDVKYDLALINELAPGQVNSVGLGDNVTFKITTTNQGNVPSNDYTVTTQIPAGTSFVSASDGGTESGGIVTWSNLANLDPAEMRMFTLVLRVDDATQSDYRIWSEISEDSATDYGTTDEDSTPDANVGNDNAAGVAGISPNDDFVNHNDISLDEPANDEDDNDYEDITLSVVYDLALVKTLATGQTASVGLGGNVTYEITVANQGNVPSNAYTVTDRIPAGMSFVSASNGGVESAGTVTWTGLANLNPGQTSTISLVVRIDDATQSDYRNWAEISDDSSEAYGVTDEDSTPDSNTGNDNASGLGTDPNDDATNHNDITLDDPAGDEDDNDYEDITLNINYDLALIKTLGVGQATTVSVGDIVVYDITVTNQGNVPSNAYTVIDNIPAGMSLVSTTDAGTASGGVVTWANLPNLNPQQTKVLNLILRVDDATQAQYRNIAEISDDSSEDYGPTVTDEDSTPDTDPNNDPVVDHNDPTADTVNGDEDDNDYEDIQVQVVYDLALVKTLAAGQPSSVTVGESVNYTITVSNQGNVPSNTYTVIDQIPAGMTFVSASNGGTESGGIVTWSNLPSIAPSTMTNLSITLRLEDATVGEYINRAEISDDSSEAYGVTDEDSTPDANPNNDPIVDNNDPSIDDLAGDEDDSDIEEIQLGVEYDLALVKTLSANQSAIVGQGDNVSYTITVANQGNVESLTYSVADQIPDGMSFVSATDGGAESAGVVTWANLATIPVGGTKTLTIVLRVDDVTKGDFRNWAEITEDSSDDYSVSDADSTPDSNTGNDNAAGFGAAPNDPVVNHNDITLDNPAGDEDDNDFEDVQAQANYDLALIKTLGDGQAATVSIGDVVVYDITVANQGNVPSGSYSVTDQIPAGMSFVTATDSGIENAGIVNWTLSNLAPGATKTISLILRVEDAAQSNFRNWAEISDDSSDTYGTTDEDSTPDTNTGNDNGNGLGVEPNDDVTDHNDITLDNPAGDEDDNDYEDVQLNIDYDLALVKTLATGQSATVSLGEVINYTITIANQGNVPSNDYVVVDQIPAGMEFVSASDFGSISGSTVTWTNLSNLNPSQTKTLSLALRVTDLTKSDFRNWAEISDDSSEDYSTTDGDSTPDSNTGNDDTDGVGTAPNDLADNHNDITLDDPAGDEDDNDFEDVSVNVIYDLALIKTLAAGQTAVVNVGDVVQYDITVTNQGNVPSNDYNVSDVIPAGMTFVSASDFGAINGTTVTWTNLANINPGQSKTLSISLRLDDPTQGTYTNRAEISADSATDYGVTDKDSTPDADVMNDPVVDHNDPTADTVPGDEDDNDLEEVSVNIKYDLALVKQLAAGQNASVSLGEVVSYTITVANQGNVASNDYTVIDQIPAGMEFVSASDFGSISGGVVTWSNLANLAPNQTKDLTLALRVTDISKSDFRNWAEISDDSSEDYGTTDEDSTPDSNTGTDNTDGLGTDPNDLVSDHNDITLDDPAGDEDDNDYEDVSVSVNYDLALIKTLADGQEAVVAAGEVITYTITVTNQGNVASNDYAVTDAIPTGMTFVSASDFGSASGNTVTWSNLPNLAPGASKALSISLRLEDPTQGTYNNIAEISDDSSEDYGVTDEDSTPDTDPTNDPIVNHNDPTADTVDGDEDDSDSEEVSVSIKYDLALVKQLAAGQNASVSLGEVVNYTITVANQGNVPSNDYAVTDQIPAGMEFVSASDFGTVSGNVVTWANLANLAPNQTKTLTIALRVTDISKSDFRNWAEISDDSSEDYGTTDEDSTPDTNVGNDDTDGLGTAPNDLVSDHNDITLDDPAGDEDDNDFADVGVTVNYDLALIKTLAAGQNAVVTAGEVVTYTITVTNQGNVASNDYAVTDAFPTGMTFVSASDFGSASGTTVTWSNLPNLAPGASKALTISLRLDDPTQGTYNNIAEISDDSSEDYGVTDEDSTPDTDPTNDPIVDHNDPTADEVPGDEDDSDSEEVAISINYDLALIKTLAAGQAETVSLGEVVNYTITVANQGNVPSNDYTVTDQIPAGMEFVSASDFGAISGSVVTWANLANLAPNQTKNLTIALRVTDISKSDFRNWAEISDDSSEDYGTTDEDSTPDTNVGNDDADGLGTAPNDPVNDHNDITLDNPAGDEDDNDFADVGVNVNYDLALVKELAGQSTTVSLGEIVNYIITVTNEGNVASNDYNVTDQIPAGMDFVSASDFGAFSAGAVTWTNLPNIDAGQSKTLTIALRVSDLTQAPFTNFAEISDDSSEDYGETDADSTPDTDPTNDPEPEDDSDTEVVDVNVVYDLALAKELAPDQSETVSLGGVVNFLITVANQGNVPSNTYAVADYIPAGLEYISASDFGVSNGSTISWSNLPSLAPGETKTLLVVLRVTDLTQAPYVNFAEITDDSSEIYGTTDGDSTPDTDPTNDPIVTIGDPLGDNPEDEDDSDTETVGVNVVYDLALIKTLATNQAATVNAGDVVNYVITVSNQGNVPSNDFSVIDVMPTGMSFISASDFGAVSGNTVNWSNLASLEPGQSKALTISLRVVK